MGRTAFFILLASLLVSGTAEAQYALDSGLGTSRINSTTAPRRAISADPYRVNRNTGTIVYDRSSAFRDSTYSMYQRMEVGRTLNNPTVTNQNFTPRQLTPRGLEHGSTTGPDMRATSQYSRGSYGVRTNAGGRVTAAGGGAADQRRYAPVSRTYALPTTPETYSRPSSVGKVDDRVSDPVVTRRATTRSTLASGDRATGSSTLERIAETGHPPDPAPLSRRTYSVLGRHAERTGTGAYGIGVRHGGER